MVDMAGVAARASRTARELVMESMMDVWPRRRKVETRAEGAGQLSLIKAGCHVTCS